MRASSDGDCCRGIVAYGHALSTLRHHGDCCNGFVAYGHALSTLLPRDCCLRARPLFTLHHYQHHAVHPYLCPQDQKKTEALQNERRLLAPPMLSFAVNSKPTCISVRRQVGFEVTCITVHRHRHRCHPLICDLLSICKEKSTNAVN